jgi:hypothetical protein
VTELCFPAGVVRIDETLIWRKLADWLSQADGREVRMRRSQAFGDYACQLVDDGAEVLGRSRLSAADALAQALQISLSKEAS